MKIRDLQMSLEPVNGGLSKVLLGAKTPYWGYKEKQKTTEEPVGIRYSVALIGNHLAALDVKGQGHNSPSDRRSHCRS